MKLMSALLNYRKTFGPILIVISLFIICWLLWPFQHLDNWITFLPGELKIDTTLENQISESVADDIPVFPGKVAIILEGPGILRKGEQGRVGLKIIQDFSFTDNGSISNENTTAIKPGSGYVNIYADYSVIVTARLVIENIPIDPVGEIGTILTEGQNIQYTWGMSPVSTGDYKGAVWIHLTAISDNGMKVFNQAVSAQEYKIKVISLLNLDIKFIWILSIIFLVGGLILYFDLKPSTNWGKR